MVKRGAVALLLAIGVSAAAVMAQSNAVDAHLAAAKAAAGADFAGVFNRICTEAVPPSTPAARAAAVPPLHVRRVRRRATPGTPTR